MKPIRIDKIYKPGDKVWVNGKIVHIPNPGYKCPWIEINGHNQGNYIMKTVDLKPRFNKK